MTHRMNQQEIAMLREEIEILMAERTALLRIAGAAAVLVANTDGRLLPPEATDAADMLSRLVNALPEDTLKEALDTVHAVVNPDEL